MSKLRAAFGSFFAMYNSRFTLCLFGVICLHLGDRGFLRKCPLAWNPLCNWSGIPTYPPTSQPNEICMMASLDSPVIWEYRNPEVIVVLDGPVWQFFGCRFLEDPRSLLVLGTIYVGIGSFYCLNWSIFKIELYPPIYASSIGIFESVVVFRVR